jgi:hypothetical protein
MYEQNHVQKHVHVFFNGNITDNIHKSNNNHIKKKGKDILDTVNGGGCTNTATVDYVR